MIADAGTWRDANQRYLLARLAVVRERLRRRADPPESDTEAARQALPAPSALDTVADRFGLSVFETELLVLAAGMELDPEIPALCAAAQANQALAYPTFALALAVLPQPHWSALAPVGKLRRWRLIELGAGESLVSRQIRVAERVLHYLTGISYLDERFRGLVEPLAAPERLTPSLEASADAIAGHLGRAPETGPWPLIKLLGDSRAARRAAAAAACAHLDLEIYRLRAADLPVSGEDRERLARLWERESILSGFALLIEADETEDKRSLEAASAFAENLDGPTLIAGGAGAEPSSRAVVQVEANAPSALERQALWSEALGPRVAALNGRLDALAAQFQLDADSIRAVALETPTDDRGLARWLWSACCARTRPSMEGLAQRIVPAARWDDLVLPPPQMHTLRAIAAQVRQRTRVYQQWGFAEHSARGLGIHALFAGPSGTGKTLAAEVLAHELELDLFRIDLSQVVSKYIGETEKNLRTVFDAAEAGGAILLFDEADALFGKRSDVKDSHDRYANIEVSYLLQRVEAYRGLAILTTNAKGALDPSFLRRIRFVVQFPFPDAALRAQIWRRLFTPRVPAEGIEMEKLARLNVAGGNIRNIGLHAAFLAADAGEPVRMTHLLQAARLECAKIEKQLSEVEVAGWV